MCTPRFQSGYLTLVVSFGISLPPAAAQQDTARASNMNLVGYNDLQARSAYQPVIQKQGERWIAYIGHHGGDQPNPLTGKTEHNGTSIVDVTDPKSPRYLTHIPGEAKEGTGESGGASMVRVCAGNDLPHGEKNKFYMLRSFGNSAHEMWDVTEPTRPTRINVIVSCLRDTHKIGGNAIPGSPTWFRASSGGAFLAWRKSTI